MADIIVGNDISQFQGQIDWSTYKNNTNFVWMRASEGTTIIDTEFGNNRQQARTLNIPRGFYHVSDDQLGNTPEQEASWFQDLLDGDPILPGENVALDYGEEGTSSDPAAWVLAWCEQIHSHYDNITIWLYLNQNLANNIDWTSVINLGYVKLWGAGYTSSPTDTAGLNFGWWGVPLLRQWTDGQGNVPGISGNVDGDVFTGSAQEFEGYGFQAPKEETTTPPSSQNTPTAPVEPSIPSTIPSDTQGQVSKEQAPVQQAPTPPAVPSDLTPAQQTFFQELINWFQVVFQKKNE